MNPMRVFGFDHPHLERKPQPAGAACARCEQPIQDWDVGFIIDCYSEQGVQDHFYHRDCFLAELGFEEHQP